MDESWPTDGIADLVLRAPQGRRGARAGRAWRPRTPSCASCACGPALIFKREAASEIRRLLRRAVAARRRWCAPGCCRVLPLPAGLVLAGRARRRRRRGLPAGRHRRPRARRLQRRRRAGARRRDARPRARRARRSRCRRASCARRPTSPGARACSPRRRAGSTWAWRCPSCPRAGSARSSGGRRARGADAALLELLEGIRDRAGAATPPLDPGAGGPLRTGELLTGVGGRNP